HWTRTHVASRARMPTGQGESAIHRIRIEVPGEVLGSMWIVRRPTDGEPDRVETRILSAAADQLGQAVRRDQLARDALEAEVVRRSDGLKTALLDSVSHDLRTPLATIRAAAGSLLDPAIRWSDSERREALRSIDLEAERMNRLVRNLLDLSRIEGDALRPELEPHDVDELVDRVVRRIATGKTVRVDLPPDLPPILVDDTYLDEVVTNLVENAVRHGGPTIRVGALESRDDGVVVITVEDDGEGVPDADLGHLFEKFYRVSRRGEGSRRGMGIGLTVANGLTLAMGGTLEAGRSPLGGLALNLRLPSVAIPPEPALVAASDCS
ncbi:MAG: sensor histidine kinase, partial [Candidatus Limnocylindrales bacterium]